MIKKTLLLLATALCLFSTENIFAQSNEESLDIRPFGLGLHVEQFKLSDLTMDITTAPANKLVFTISPANFIRIEPEVGFNLLNNKEEELKDLSVHVGTGVYGMFQKGRTNFYGGLKFEYANISNEYIDWNTNDKMTEKVNRITVGPTIGAEYFFGRHFSFGGEIGLKYMSLTSKDSQYGDSEVNQSYLTTDSGLLLRFYF